jgi:hypothetical protein
MFPYADDELSFWTGYFTSRSNAKGYVRRGSSIVQSANKIFGADIIDQSKSQSRFQEIITAQAEALDHMGILQHHDAVTGTAKQAVAENYNSRIFRGIQATNNVFVKSLDDYVKQVMPTIQTNVPWTWCVRDNSTYLDCPVSEQPASANITIAAFNPAATPMDLVSIIVKTPHYSVQAYNHTTGSWVSLGNDSAAIICENETLSNGFTIDSCVLHVAYPVDGH